MSGSVADLGLSVVIPAYNEQARLGATLERVTAWLQARGGDGEVVVVDDGSSDGTATVAESWRGRAKVAFQVLRNPGNLGKGASIQRGVAAASLPVVLFSDADLSTPIEEADKLLELIRSGHDVAIGSRAAAGARIEVRQPWYREMMGKCFNLLVRALTGLPFRDTQCGFKAFRSEVAKELFAALQVRRFGFDVEVIYLARRLGYRVGEAAVVWRDSPASRVHPLRDSARMAADVLLVRLRGLPAGVKPARAGRDRVVR